MRLTTLRVTRDRTAAARIDRKYLTLLPHTDVGALVASDPDWARAAAAHDGERLPLRATTPAQPLFRPGRVVRAESNYPTRSKELGQDRPTAPAVRITWPAVTAGAETTVPLPAPARQAVRWGVELGVVIARRAQRVPTVAAFRHIAGYVVTVRVHDTLLIGPELVTPDQLPPGARGLTLTGTLDGRLVQKANTSELRFDVATLVAHASTVTELRPGDLLTTGTPGGALDHPLAPGQHVRAAIKGLGEIEASCAAAAAQDAVGRTPLSPGA
ncbi:fumarylacetoacetate hydrolase family protein [Streptomyces sp. NPDC057694]|uniref:fumarylacetoacetate hydrolase family protein n=1 Tax=Streptomyces sp. NPDC057694 TaxID=3346216 RepID=UPI0036B0FCE2